MSTRTERIEEVPDYDISSDFEDDESDFTYISDSDVVGIPGRPHENGSYNGHYALLVNHEIYQFLAYKDDAREYSGPLEPGVLNIEGETFAVESKSVLGKRKRSKSIGKVDFEKTHNVAGVIWTEEEKELFFQLLSRKSRHNLADIAREMGTKSLVEVEEYHDMLWMAAQQQPSIDLRDVPAAREMSDDWVLMEENQGGSIQIVEEKNVHYSLDNEGDELLLNMEFLENFLFAKYRRLMTISNSFVEDAEAHLQDLVCTIMTVVAQWKLRQQRATIVPQLAQTPDNSSNVVTMDEMQNILHDMGLLQENTDSGDYEELRPYGDVEGQLIHNNMIYQSSTESTDEDDYSDDWSDVDSAGGYMDERNGYNIYDNIDPGIFMSDHSGRSSDPERSKSLASRISQSSLASQVSMASPELHASYPSDSSELSDTSHTQREPDTLECSINSEIPFSSAEDASSVYGDYDIIIDGYPSEDEESEIDNLLDRETEILDYHDLKCSHNEEKILTQWLLSGEQLPPYSEAQMHTIERHLRKHMPTHDTTSYHHADEPNTDIQPLSARKPLSKEEQGEIASSSHFNLFMEST